MMKQATDVRSPMMVLQTTECKGLTIKWNFAGLISQNSHQIYHLFVLVNVEIQFAQQLLKIFYFDMKLGALIGIANKKNMNLKTNKIEWYEKTNFQLNQHIILHYDDIWDTFEEENLLKLIYLVQKLNGLINFNFVLQNEHNIGKTNMIVTILKQKIAQIRAKIGSKDNIIFNILYKNEHEIQANCRLGINYLPISIQKMEDSIKNMNSYLKMLVIRRLRVRIYLDNGIYFKINNNLDWKNLDAPYIQKLLYGVLLAVSNKTQYSQYRNVQEIHKYNQEQVQIYNYTMVNKQKQENSTLAAHTHNTQNPTVSSPPNKHSEEPYSRIRKSF